MANASHHTVTLDSVEVGAEPIVFTQDGGDWSIHTEEGESLATGEEWYAEDGRRCVALTLLSPGVDANLVRKFVESQTAGSDTPTY